MIIIYQVVIVKISSYFLSRIHNCIQIEFLTVRERRKIMRKHRCLYLCGKRKFRTDTLGFLGNLGNLSNVLLCLLRQIIKRFREYLDLIIRVIDRFHLEQFACIGTLDDILRHGLDRLNDSVGHDKSSNYSGQH